MTCFAGLQKTAVPVVVGSQVVAQLKTGQIFHETPTKTGFAKAVETLSRTEGGDDELEKAYLASPVIGKQRYQAMITLLAAFSLQLSQLANQLARELEHEEEDIIETTKDDLERNLGEPIHLEEVARQLGMSPFYFCRKFKKSTGMTFTSFVSQRRIELAKDFLVNGETKITDIAYNSGFQSLSQFNRTFRKIVGLNPTEYRRQAA
jgi:AraC-like DNA-binding protein